MSKKADTPRHKGYSRTTPYGKKYIGEYPLHTLNYTYSNSPRRKTADDSLDLPFIAPYRSSVIGRNSWKTSRSTGSLKVDDKSKLPKHSGYQGTFTLPKHKDYKPSKVDPFDHHKYEKIHEYHEASEYQLNYTNFFGFSHSIDKAKGRKGRPKLVRFNTLPKSPDKTETDSLAEDRRSPSPVPVVVPVAAKAGKSKGKISTNTAATQTDGQPEYKPAAVPVLDPGQEKQQQDPPNYGSLPPLNGNLPPLVYSPRVLRIVYHHQGPPPPDIQALYFPDGGPGKNKFKIA